MPAQRAMSEVNAPLPGHPSESIPHGMDLSGLSGEVSVRTSSSRETWFSACVHGDSPMAGGTEFLNSRASEASSFMNASFPPLAALNIWSPGDLHGRKCHGSAHSILPAWYFAADNPGEGCVCLLGCLAGLGCVRGGVVVGRPAVPAPCARVPIPRHLLETGPRNGAFSTTIFDTFWGFKTTWGFCLW